MPKPTPVCAPSIKPGKSATTNVRPPPFSDRLPGEPIRGNNAEPRLQCGKRIIRNFRMRRGEIREMSVDFPTFGNPRKANVRQLNFNSKCEFRSAPGWPSSDSRGTWCQGLAVLVTAPAAPARRDQNALAQLGQIGNQFAVSGRSQLCRRERTESCLRPDVRSSSSLRRDGRDPL